MRAILFLLKPAAAVALAMLCIVSGCSIFSGRNRSITVSDSQLNWLVVGYLPGMGKPPVQLSLMGSGNIRIKRGTSPQIGNDFSQDVANVKWNDVNVDQINVDPAQMRDIFQALANRGLLHEPDKDFVRSANRGNPTARIIGSLNNENVTRLAVEPELVGFIRDLLKLFDENKQAPESRK